MNRCFVSFACLLSLALPGTMHAGECACDNPVDCVAQPVCECACECAAAPVWSLTTEALWLQRASGQAVLESAGTTGGPIDQSYVGDTFEPGIRMELRRTDACGNAWELGYFGLQHWEKTDFVLGDPIGQSVLVTSPVLRLDDFIGGFDLVGAYQYRSRVQNGELNRWWIHSQTANRTISLMYGIRYFEFQEKLTLAAADTTFGAEIFDGASYNALLGAQVGGKIERDWNCWSFNLLGKAGLYGNNYNSRTTDLVIGAPGFPQPFINNTQSDIGVAGILEARAGAKYRLTDCLAVTGGYTVMYIPGLSMQPSSEIGFGTNNDDGLVLHGASVGVEVVW